MSENDPNRTVPRTSSAPDQTADHAPADDTNARAGDESAADPNRPASDTPGVSGTVARTPWDVARLEEVAQAHSAEGVPGYVLLGELGRGGMGVVHKARHLKLNRIVALKMMLGGERATRGDLLRFLAEAEAVAAVRHDNVVQVYDYGESGGRPYMALEYCPGGTLGKLLPKGRDAARAPREMAALIAKVARGVAAAHAQGIIHRDLKPGNVFLDEVGVPKVADFGLAKRGEGSDVTKEGVGMGTPSYMAPEQARDAKFVGPQADVWAIGVILYEAITGTRPFTGTVQEVMAKAQNVEPLAPRKAVPAVPYDLELICLKCLSKAPHERYPTAKDLADDLDRYARGEPISVRPAGRIERAHKWVKRNPVVSGAVTAVFLALTVGLAVSLWQMDRAGREAARADGKATEAFDNLTTAQAETTRADEKATEAIKQTKRADAKAKEAEDNLTTARGETRRAEGLLIASRLQQTLDATAAGNIRLANSLLNDCQWHLRGWEYRHLWTRVTPLQSFEVKASLVGSLGFSSDGSVLVASSFTNVQNGRAVVVRAWNLESGAESLLPVPPGDELTKVVAGGEKHEMLGVRNDLCVQRWDLRTGRLTRASTGNPTEPGKPNFISHVCLSPDHKFIAYAPSIHASSPQFYIQTVKLWDVEKDAFAKTLTRHTNAIGALKYSPKGTHIATTSSDKTVKLWDLEAGTESLVDLGESASKIWFTPDGTGLLALTRADNKAALKLWDIAGKKVTREIPLEGADVHELDFTADGKTFATGEHDGRVRVWDFDSGKLLRTYYGHTSPVHLVRFSADGRRLATADYANAVHVWGADRNPAVPTLSAGKSPVHAAAFSPDGKTFATGGQDQMLSVWDTDGRSLVKSWKVQTPQDRYVGPIHDLSYSPDGTQIATCGEEVKLWDVKTGGLVRAFRGHVAVVFNLTFSPDGQRLYASPVGHHPQTGATSAADVWVWEVSTGKKLAQFTAAEKRVEHEGGRVDALTFSPDGRLVTTSLHPTSGGVIKFWDTADHTLVRTMGGHRGRVLSVAFSRDGARAASSCSGDELVVWNLKTGKQLHKTRVRGGQLDRLRFSPDGARLFAGCSDGSIRVWDPDLFQEMLALPGHANGNVKALDLSPDGKRLVSGGKDGSILLWESLRTPEYADLNGHRAPVTAIAFAPDGSRVFAWDKSGDLLAWSLRDGSPAETEGAPAKGTEGAVTSADGRFRAEPFGSLANGNVAVRVRFLNPKQ